MCIRDSGGGSGVGGGAGIGAAGLTGAGQVAQPLGVLDLTDGGLGPDNGVGADTQGFGTIVVPAEGETIVPTVASPPAGAEG